jgi:hypothetical protein
MMVDASATLSKRLCYGLVAAVLLIAVLLLLYLSARGNDIATRLLPTFVGLSFTFGFFIVFFDLREELEWRAVAKRVKRRIGRHLQTVFTNVVLITDVESVILNPQSQEDWNKLSERQLTQLATGRFGINDLWKEGESREALPKYYRTLEARLGEIEDRYGKFLDSKVQNALMDIEDFLHELAFSLQLSSADRAAFIVKELGKKLVFMRESGIDIGF